MKFEIYIDAKNEWRWRLKASNGKTIADSGEGYINQDDCLHGITLVQATHSQTPVEYSFN